MERGGRVGIIDDLFVRAMQVAPAHDHAAAVAVYRRVGCSPMERLHLTVPLALPTHVDR